MESGRFEALIDAILAIIITIIVLEIPIPADGSWQALGKLHLEFIVYLISFIVCFNYWNYHNHLFSIVNHIDHKVIWSSGISIFILSLLPYLTSFVANNFHSFFAQSIYGLDFILVNLIYIYTSESLKNADKGNIALQVALDKNYEFTATIATIIIGYVIGYFFYPPAIIASCLVAIIIIWSIPHIIK